MRTGAQVLQDRDFDVLQGRRVGLVTNQTALDAITRLFSDTSGKANLVVLPQSSEDTTIPSYIVDRIETFPGVALAIPSLHLSTVLAEDDQVPDLYAHPLAREDELFPFSLHQLLFGVGNKPTHRALFRVRDDKVLVHMIRHLAQDDVTPNDVQ